jgi:hypothetical protein
MINPENPLEKLLVFTRRLDAAQIHYRLTRPRDEAIMVEIVVPGERWEMEFFADSHVEVEVFSSSTGVVGEERVNNLFERHFD